MNKDYRDARMEIGTISEVAGFMGITPEELAARENGETLVTPEQDFAMRWLLVARKLKIMRDDNSKASPADSSLEPTLSEPSAMVAAEVLLSGGFPLELVAETLRKGKVIPDRDDLQAVASALRNPEKEYAGKPGSEYFIGIVETCGDALGFQILQKGEPGPGVRALAEMINSSVE